MARGCVEIQVRSRRKWRISRTGTERTLRYVSTGSAEIRHLRPASPEYRHSLLHGQAFGRNGQPVLEAGLADLELGGRVECGGHHPLQRDGAEALLASNPGARRQRLAPD